jgi:hypothetical protein
MYVSLFLRSGSWHQQIKYALITTVLSKVSIKIQMNIA